MKRGEMRSRTRRSLALIGSLVALATVVGCATPQPDAVPAFRQGVVTASQQTSTAFSDVNELLREQQLDRVARQATLNEAQFAEALPADARATWMRAFRLMDEYASKLAQLLAPEQRAGVEAELRKLGDKLSATRDEPLPDGVAGGFVKLGGLLVQIKAGQDALETMRKVDPAIQSIFSAMADAIGSSNADGIRQTVWSAWTFELGKLQVEFLNARKESGKRRVAEKYLNMLGERDAHDRLLGSLRISFVSLGNAHAAMARDNPLNASAFIAIVQDEYKGLREEIAQLRESRKKN